MTNLTYVYVLIKKDDVNEDFTTIVEVFEVEADANAERDRLGDAYWIEKVRFTSTK